MSKRIPIFLGILLIFFAIWALIRPPQNVRQLIVRLENLGYDLQIRTQSLNKPVSRDNPVAIIDIDDKSLQAEGRWPWERGKIGQLVNQLAKQGAAVIVFDIVFPEKERNIATAISNELKEKNLLTPSFDMALKKIEPSLDEDMLFANALTRISSVLAIGFSPRTQAQNHLPPPLFKLTPEEKEHLAIKDASGYISNIPILQQAAKVGGFINIFSDSDGIIRRAPLVIQYHQNVYPSLALQAVLSFLGEKPALITQAYSSFIKLEGVQVGSRIIPTDARGQVFIPFIGRSYTFPYYSATDVLHGRIADEDLLGKILFIGTSATGMGDLEATSIQSPFPGVEIQASVANGILTSHFSYKPAWTLGANLFLTILFGLITTLCFPFLGPKSLSFIIVFLPVLMLFLNHWLWVKTGLILSLLIPVSLVLIIGIINLVYGYLFEKRKREHLKTMFGQYVPAKHIDEMIKTSSDYALQGEDRDMSVLFADIRNFTSISENLKAKKLVELLNTFFTPMTEIIFKHHGTIDKYVGDLIMAFWGAPLHDKNHAANAVQSALEMLEKVDEFRVSLAPHQWPDIKIGIGINSGIMSVGDMGSRFRRNYTVLGDAVNLASRAESLTKFYGVNIIVTEYTQQHLISKFVFRKLDRVRVKGKKKGVEIYEAICLIAKSNSTLTAELDLYHQAQDFYFSQQWDQADTIFSKLHQQNPHKTIYKIYLERINEFKKSPPPAEWDGVYVHETK